MQLLSDIYFQRYPWGTICNLTDIRVRSNDAIRYVRLKRPNMVQTRRQIQCVKEFETYFLPQVKSFPIRFFPVCNQTISPKIFIFSASCTAQNPQMSEIKSSADFRSRPAWRGFPHPPPPPCPSCPFSGKSTWIKSNIFRQKYLV